jgi:hypothetical protein
MRLNGLSSGEAFWPQHYRPLDSNDAEPQLKYEQGITDIEVHVYALFVALCRLGILLLHNRGPLGVSCEEAYRASMGRGLSLRNPPMLLWTMK